MKTSKILSALLSLCLLLTMLPTAAIADSTHSTVSGTIWLPGTDTAPSGGVKVTLTITTDNLTPTNKNDDVTISQVLSIAQGQRGISYSIMVPKSTNRRATYSVSYTAENGYAPFGYYSANGTTAIKAEQTLVNLNAGNVSNVDITLLPGRIISGKLMLRNQTTAPSNDMPFTITAIVEGNNTSSTDDDIVIAKEVIIKSGQMEADYSLLVPQNPAGKGYKLYYEYKSGTYKEIGYYHATGTSEVAERVTLIDVSNTVTGINLSTQPHTNVNGTVILPDNAKATGSGVEVTITALNTGALSDTSDDFYIQQKVTIPRGANSTNYSLTVPVKSTGYTVSYSVSRSTGYIPEGFYSTNGTQSTRDIATLIGTGIHAITGINLTLLKTATPIATPTPTPTVTPTPTPVPSLSKYDLNGDGVVDIRDMVALAKVIIAQEKEAGKRPPSHNKKIELSNDDLKALRDVFKPFDNNRNKMKLFNNFNQWMKYGPDDQCDDKNKNKGNDGKGNINK